MNTLDAGVTEDKVMRMFSLNVSERDRSCWYLTDTGSTPGSLLPALSVAAARSSIIGLFLPLRRVLEVEGRSA